MNDPLLAEIVRRLAEVYSPERIYLFGSTARGDAGHDSDYDLITRHAWEFRYPDPKKRLRGARPESEHEGILPRPQPARAA